MNLPSADMLVYRLLCVNTAYSLLFFSCHKGGLCILFYRVYIIIYTLIKIIRIYTNLFKSSLTNNLGIYLK